MKKFLILIGVTGMVTLYSCGGAGSEAANKMADEMCAAMAKFNEADANSMLEAASDMMEISKKEDEYGKVTEAQLQKAMEDKCPEGWAKFEELSGK